MTRAPSLTSNDALHGELQIAFEEGHVTELVVSDPRTNASLRKGNQIDKIDALRLAEPSQPRLSR
jgi:hypothetical protein